MTYRHNNNCVFASKTHFQIFPSTTGLAQSYEDSQASFEGVSGKSTLR